MEERRLVEKFNDAFARTMPILENVKKGFFTQKPDVLKENKSQFREMLKSRAVYVQQVIEEKDRNEARKQYLMLIPSFQTISLAIENLINKMETKVELNILFSEKALGEIKELFTAMEEQFRDARDYIATKNPHLKSSIKADMERIFEIADKCSLVHQGRLIAGICVPQASYLYLDITDSIKRISRGLNEFSEKV